MHSTMGAQLDIMFTRRPINWLSMSCQAAGKLQVIRSFPFSHHMCFQGLPAARIMVVPPTTFASLARSRPLRLRPAKNEQFFCLLRMHDTPSGPFYSRQPFAKCLTKFILFFEHHLILINQPHQYTHSIQYSPHRAVRYLQEYHLIYCQSYT